MVLLAHHRGTPCVISLKSHSVAASVGDRGVVAWDRGGRLYSVVEEGTTWRRGLSGAVLETRHHAGARHRRILPPQDADALVDRAAGFAASVHDAMASPDWRWVSRQDAVTVQEATMLLAFFARFDAASARADAVRFAATYRPIGILPPDQYLSLVVQATEGCAFNTCTFCNLYHEPYRVKSADAFRAHVAEVRHYLGASVELRSRGIFLGAANALAVPMAGLLPLFDILIDELDALRRGVAVFVDGFTGSRKDAHDYRVLAQSGLRRVYVGLESGHDPLLTFVGKPATAAQAVETVRAAKAGGIPVGVIVMTGLGGRAFADAHVADTARAVTAMGLADGDLLYFSELVADAASAYPRQAAAGQLGHLDHDACIEQREAIKAACRFAGRPPQLATYDIREFVY